MAWSREHPRITTGVAFLASYTVADVLANLSGVYLFHWVDPKFGPPSGTFWFGVQVMLVPGAALSLLGFALGMELRSRYQPNPDVSHVALAMFVALGVVVGQSVLAAGAIGLGGSDAVTFLFFVWFMGGGSLLLVLAAQRLIVRRDARRGRVAV